MLQRASLRYWWMMAVWALSALLAMSSITRACPGMQTLNGPEAGRDESDTKPKPKKKKKPSNKKEVMVRWGQKRTETDEQYDKRYAKVLLKVKQDKRGDLTDGTFMNGKNEEVRLWTYMGNPFIVRSDISKEFTADTAMYMEMLHREYGRAYALLLGGIESHLGGEKIEVLVFADQATYAKNGGPPGSGGFFRSFGHLLDERGPHWPAKRYLLQQFTDGATDFRKWEKGTLKHEAAHMELQLRLGNTLFPGENIGVPVQAPRWWNEGHAAVFEYWDFDKTVEENFAEVPNRGRYAPVIRRIFDTDKWKDFNYVWTINGEQWSNDMTSSQGFLNYAQAWSLAAYMMNGGKKGRQDFQAIFNLSKKVGVDRQTTVKGDRSRTWEQKFPDEIKVRLEKNWTDWVRTNLPKDKAVPDEDYFLKRNGYKPDVTDHLENFTSDEYAKLRKEIDDEEKRRKDSDEIER
jgi:hypothetical protein